MRWEDLPCRLRKKMLMLRLVVAKPTDEAVLLELEARLKALEAAVRCGQETPKEQQETEELVKRDLGKVAQRKG